MKKMKGVRKLSDHFVAFVSLWKDKCKGVKDVRLEKKEKGEVPKDILIMECELKSRWAAIQGPGGLTTVLVNQVNGMVRLRLTLEYGDYLAGNLKVINLLKAADQSKWRQDKRNWRDVAKFLDMELREEKRFTQAKRWDETTPPPASTLYLDDVRKAAKQLDITDDQLIYEIQAYAARNANAHAHSGVGALADRAEWDQLARQIARDKQHLRLAYHGSLRQEHIQMRQAIERFQSLWFQIIWWVDDSRTVIHYLETPAAAKRKARLAAKAKSSMII